MSNILLAVPTYENIMPDTYESLWNLERDGHNVQFRFVRGYDCATARNNIAQIALCGFDYVLMVDNDVVLPTGALIHLMEDPKDVCLGYYPHRGVENLYTGSVNVCKLTDKDGNIYDSYPLESEYFSGELIQRSHIGINKVQIHGGGLGCALINTDVFRRLEYPWFSWINYNNEERSVLSEDLYFCEKCRAAEIPIFVDTRVGCGHMFRRIQWPE